MLNGGLKCQKKETVLSLENGHPAKFPVPARKRVLEKNKKRRHEIKRGRERERVNLL